MVDIDNSSELIESLLIESRITPIGNGSNENNEDDVTLANDTVTGSQVTSGQKWWAAVLLGFIFFLISSPVAYNITSQVTLNTIGVPLMYGTGPTLAGLLIHTVIFVLIVRVILW